MIIHQSESRPERLPGVEDDLPPVDVIVAVFNELRTIEGRIASLLELDYPGDRLRFVVVDGGSCGGTTARIPCPQERSRRSARES